MVFEFADGELAEFHRRIGIDHGFGVDQPEVQRLGHGKDLEGRAKFIDALHGAVEQGTVRGVAGQRHGRAVVGVEIGQRGERQQFAAMDVHQDGCGALGVHHPHAGGENLFDIGLQGQVKRQDKRGRGLRRVAQAGIKRLFKASRADDFGAVDAFGTESRTAEDMGGQGAIGVKPHLARAEIQAGVADVMDHLHLFGA